jgi:UDP-N-acetylmuramate dehydrogenase
MQILHNVSLKPYNTFGMDVTADALTFVDHVSTLEAIGNDTTLPPQKHVLGGGSNILLTGNVTGLLLVNRLKGITVLREDEEHVWVQVQSGEVWHELVLHAIANGWAGIENLALIPGTVGAAPIQNIGAYGVEVKETIDTVHAWHWEERKIVSFTNEDCHFGYRDSIFKHTLKDKIFITLVVFRLSKKPVFHTTYGAISQELEKNGIQQLSIKAIADAVIAIRSSKLPDPKQIGNAGSFFKNPVITAEHFELLQTNYPDIPSYPAGDDQVKVPAGWLIEKAGWKGYRAGDAGVHEKQALVLVNYAHAGGAEIWSLSGEIVQSVKERFGIVLEREVQVW